MISKQSKLISPLLTGLLLLAGQPVAAEWLNICAADQSQNGCDQVGKTAFNNLGPPIMRSVEIGPIIGVVYKLKGGLVSRPEAEAKQLAPRNAFYFIIGPGGVADYEFLRDTREIAAK